MTRRMVIMAAILGLTLFVGLVITDPHNELTGTSVRAVANYVAGTLIALGPSSATAQPCNGQYGDCYNGIFEYANQYICGFCDCYCDMECIPTQAPLYCVVVDYHCSGENCTVDSCIGENHYCF